MQERRRCPALVIIYHIGIVWILVTMVIMHDMPLMGDMPDAVLHLQFLILRRTVTEQILYRTFDR